MVRFLFRFMGGVFLGLSFFPIYLELKTAFAGVWQPISLGQLWYDFHRASLNTFQAAVQRYAAPEIWEYGFQPLLSLPAWLVIASFAVLMMFLGVRRDVYQSHTD